MSPSQTAYGQFKNVVVFIFASELEANVFIQQLQTKEIMSRLRLPKIPSFRPPRRA